MQTQDGFIVGVYHYCDRWCERCSLASRCRVHATELQMAIEPPPAAAAWAAEAAPPSAAPALRSLGAVAAWFAEGVPDGFDGPDQPQDESDAPLPSFEQPLPPAETALYQRIHALGMRLWNWPAPPGRPDDPAVADAVEVIRHFALYIGAKVYRALHGRRPCEEDGMQSDALGSAKAALLALDRMGDAWLVLAERGAIGVLDAAPILTELQQLSGELEALFPRARDFVRPGFDEPAAVAMLEWRERG